MSSPPATETYPSEQTPSQVKLTPIRTGSWAGKSVELDVTLPARVSHWVSVDERLSIYCKHLKRSRFIIICKVIHTLQGKLWSDKVMNGMVTQGDKQSTKDELRRVMYYGTVG